MGCTKPTLGWLYDACCSPWCYQSSRSYVGRFQLLAKMAAGAVATVWRSAAALPEAQQLAYRLPVIVAAAAAATVCRQQFPRHSSWHMLPVIAAAAAASAMVATACHLLLLLLLTSQQQCLVRGAPAPHKLYQTHTRHLAVQCCCCLAAHNCSSSRGRCSRVVMQVSTAFDGSCTQSIPGNKEATHTYRIAANLFESAIILVTRRQLFGFAIATMASAVLSR